MTEYYTADSVRKQLEGKYDIRSSIEKPVPVGWNKCPCETISWCEKRQSDSCYGIVNIYINSMRVRWLHLKIYYFRIRQKGFIEVRNEQLQVLLELGVIDETLLVREAF